MNDSTNAPAVTGDPKRRRALAGVTLVFAAGLAGWGGWWYAVSRHHVTTDNAYVGGHVVQITPQTGGTVQAILADDTDIVRPGQPLVRLDDADARMALEQAEAQLAQAVREVRQLYANEGAAGAQVGVREAELARAQADATRLEAEIVRARTEAGRATDDLKRRQALASSGAVSKEEVEHAAAAVANARAALDAATAGRDAARSAAATARAAIEAARRQQAASRTLVGGTDVSHHPAVERAAANLRAAWLALRRTEVVAPLGGQVARRAAQVGQRVQAGAPLMAIVPLEQVWVDANFKEVQLRDLRIGQPVTLVADAWGDGVTYHGRVAGLGAGTGAAFALLPAQNATGNWIKVVQRLPVRIELDPAELAAHPLRVGLSMQADVDVRDKSGAAVAQAPRAKPVAVIDARAVDAGDADAKRDIARILAANGVASPDDAAPSVASKSAARPGPASAMTEEASTAAVSTKAVSTAAVAAR